MWDIFRAFRRTKKPSVKHSHYQSSGKLDLQKFSGKQSQVLFEEARNVQELSEL